MSEPQHYCSRCRKVHGAWSCPQESFDTIESLRQQVEDLRKQLTQREKVNQLLAEIDVRDNHVEQLQAENTRLRAALKKIGWKLIGRKKSEDAEITFRKRFDECRQIAREALKEEPQ